MNYNNFQFIVDIVTFTVLITLSVYHFLIYWRRRNYSEEHYNLYFSFFTILVTAYLFLESPMFVLRVVNERIYGDWIPFTEGTIVFFVFLNLTKFFSKLINFPVYKEKYIRYGFYLFIISLSLPFLGFIKGWDWYNQNINDFFVSIVTLFILFISYLYGDWIYKNKLYKKNNFKVIITGICILIFSLLAVKISEIIYYPLTFRGNNFIIIGVVLLFAYALMEKFNKEFEELILLKENLEQKIIERTKELTKAKEQIESVNKERSDFFINLAHETKTPLTIISNYVDKYIDKYGLNKEIEIIKRNIDKLCKNMADFLDLEKLIKGKLNFENFQTVNFSEILNEIVILFKEYARSKNINFRSDTESNLFVKADPHVIESIILNLIENAIKYTPPGGEIDTILNCSKNKLIFIVSDKGIGIPESKLPHIFEPYYQASHKKLNTQGIGIGLYVVKRSIELLNGSIQVESVENKGTTFRVTLPICNPEIEEKINIHSAGKTSISEQRIREQIFDPQKKSILIVEDNIELSNYLIEELSEEYNVSHANNGLEGLEKINNIPFPVLIISDIMMDEMDGEKFHQQICSISSYKNIPFIFLTAKTQKDEKIKMLQAGAIDYIYKPFSIIELKAKIKSVINNAQKQKQEALKQVMDVVSNQLVNPAREVNEIKKSFEERCREFQLTERQIEVIRFAAEGFEYKEIADKLNISTKTVLRHIDILFKKLEVHNKVELINKLYK